MRGLTGERVGGWVGGWEGRCAECLAAVEGPFVAAVRSMAAREPCNTLNNNSQLVVPRSQPVERVSIQQ